MGINQSLADTAVLKALGERLARRRLDLELTQATVAEEAGVSKRTVERMEQGATVQLANFIRILRALGLLEQLNELVPEPQPRPLELLKLGGKTRQRAPSPNRVAESDDAPGWQWGDDT